MALLADLFGLQTDQPLPPTIGDDEMRRAISERVRQAMGPITTGPLPVQAQELPAAEPVRDYANTAVQAPYAPSMGSMGARPQPVAAPAPAPQPAVVSPAATAPAAAPAFAPRVPQLSDRLSAFAEGYQSGGLLGAIGKAGSSIDQKFANENATAKLLMSRTGMNADEVKAVMANPAIMQQILPTVFGPKDPFIKLGPDEALYRKDTGAPVARNETSKSPDNVKQWIVYQADERAGGRTPLSIHDWDLERKRAGATAVTVDQKGHTAFSQAAGKHQAERFDKIVQDGATAKTMGGDLARLSDLASKVTTGKAAELTGILGPYVAALGIKVDGLDEIQAFNSIADRIAPSMKIPGAGATSDFDAKMFLNSLPSVGKQPGGNEIITQTFQAVIRVKQLAAEISSEALSGDITPREAEKRLQALPDPFTEFKAFQKRGGGAAPDADGFTVIDGIRIRERR